MANTVNTETLNALVSKAEENNTVNLTIGNLNGEDINIEVQKHIDINSFYTVCAALAVSPFAEAEEGFTSYTPSGEVMAFQVSMMKAFTNIELPDDVQEAYQLCAKLNLFQKVHAVLQGESDMYQDLLITARKYSDYHRLANSFTGIIDSIRDAINNLDESEVIQNVMSILAPVNTVNEDAEEIV
jgi:hypothetical protein